MKEDFSELNHEDQIKAENNILKMKLMLEKGAIFHERKEELPSEIEHQLLNQVIELEKQMEEHNTITVLDKLGTPIHFLPTNEIPETGFEKAWEELSQYMQNYGVAVSVLNPNISAKELYRFSIEEVFNQEILDLKYPGLIVHFIYDEFHSDRSANP